MTIKMATNMTDGLLSTMTLKQLNREEVLRLSPLIVYLAAISVIGALGNAMVCFIYMTQFKRSNSKYFILCLAIIDLFSSVLSHPFEIKTVMNQFTFTNGTTCRISRFVNSVPTVTSGFIFLVIAIDRYRKVCRPFGWQISTRMAKYISIGTILCGVLFSWPTLFLYGIRSFPVPELSQNATECSVRDSYKGTLFPFVYNSTLGFLFIVGSSSLVIMFTLIGREIHRHSAKMTEYSQPVELKTPNTLDLDQTDDDESSFRDSSVTSNGKMQQARMTNDKQPEHNIEETTDITKVCETGKLVIIVENKTYLDKYSDADSANGDDYSTSDETMTEAAQSRHGSLNDKTDIKPPRGSEQSQLALADPQPPVRQIQSTSDQTTTAGRSTKKPSFLRKISNLGTFISTSSNSYDVDPTRASEHYSVRSSGIGRIRERRARRISFLMFLISLAYILSYLPHVVLMMTRVLQKDFVSSMTLGQRAAYKFFLRSYALNSAVNPFIYSACDKRFRNACKIVARRFRFKKS